MKREEVRSFFSFNKKFDMLRIRGLFRFVLADSLMWFLFNKVGVLDHIFSTLRGQILHVSRLTQVTLGIGIDIFFSTSLSVKDISPQIGLAYR